MRYFLVIIVFVCFFTNCKNKNIYEKEIAVIDSTKIVLQVKLNELNRTEQNLENSGFSKFEVYSLFLNNNIKDTINRVEATFLQQFLNSGNTIKQFTKEKPDLIRQTELSIAQLQKLSTDVKENHLQQAAIQAYYSAEKNHAEELILTIEQNIKVLTMSVFAYKSGLMKTEEYIRQINNGILPTVVSDSTAE